MKQIIATLLLLISGILNAGSVFSVLIPSTISASYNGVNVEGGVKTYTLETEVYNENFYSRIKHTLANGKTYKDHEYRAEAKYKILQGRARWQKSDLADIDLYQVDLRLTWKGWSAGFLQSWDHLIPASQFVFGKEFKFAINFLIPGYVHTRSDFMTSDFGRWYSENTLKLKFKTEIKIIENIINLIVDEESDKVRVPSSYIKAEYRIKDYGTVISETMFGIEVDI